MSRAQACWPNVWRVKPVLLDAMLAPFNALHSMRELGGPIVDWIFVTCVVMWCIAIERFWYFNRILPRRRQARWRSGASAPSIRAGTRDRSAKRFSSAYRNVSARSTREKTRWRPDTMTAHDGVADRNTTGIFYGRGQQHIGFGGFAGGGEWCRASEKYNAGICSTTTTWVRGFEDRRQDGR